MTNLFPPDNRVFIEIENKTDKQIDAVITKVGRLCDLEVGQRICIVGKIDKVELQDVTEYSVHERYIVMVYE
jgi:DNA-binding MltR family transcriptional regulator